MEKRLDDIDWRIISELQRDGRLSFSALARRVNLSSPAVTERVRRLEELGVIAGYHARIDPALVGLPLTAFVQMRCAHDRCLLKTTSAEELPEVVEVHKLSGDSCSMLKVRVSSMRHLEGLFERLGQHGQLNTHIVMSTPFEDKAVERTDPEPRHVSESEGWTRPRH
jgi:Lrp/AsnC family leucine-responsive transcriptional regulator